MKIRRYTCNNMQEALLKVKMDLGSEAVIMNSRKVKKKGLVGLFSKPMIEVVAAIDDDYVKPSRSQTRTSPPAGGNARSLYREGLPEQSPGVYSKAPYSPETTAYPAYSAYGQSIPQPQMQPQSQYQPHQQPQSQNQPQLQQQPQPQPHQQPQPQPQLQQQHQSEVRSMPSEHAPSSGPQSFNVEPETAESPKLIELETKVKSMETVLEKIYRSVKNKDGSKPLDPVVEKSQGSSSGQDDLSAIKSSLTELELNSKLIDRILDKIRERGGSSEKPEEALALAARVLTVLLGEPDTIKLRSDGRPQVVLFVGPTGVGKTTTLAKIAADFTLNRQKKVGLITADTYRIAAVEQLKTYAEILNVPVSVIYSPNEIQEAIKRLSDKDLILIDTAGRSHRNKTHFDELKALVSSVEADEAYLVVSANTSKFAVKEILEYYSFIKQYKLLFTKLDEAPVPGVIVNARYLTGRPLSYTTAGQSVPDDLDVANPRAIIASLLGPGTNP